MYKNRAFQRILIIPRATQNKLECGIIGVMKQTFAAFFLFVAVIASLMLFLGKSIHATDASEKDLATCYGQNACVQGPLSVFTESESGENTTKQPNGFCLMVPVLLYHHIQPQSDAIAKGQTSLSVDNGIFDQQMAYLSSRGYTAISAQQLVNAILSHTTLPEKSIVVTMDDGYLDNYIYAFPTLQKYHLIGNLMVPTGLLGIVSGTNTYYTWDNLKQMVSSGTMFAYDHTWSHYPLAQGPKEKDVQEITTAQKQLQQYLGVSAPIFVYPYGSGQTISWVQNVLKDNGFVAGFSTLPGVYQCEGNIMDLPRIHIGNAPLSSYGL